ncbi:MAG: hypothetical protein ACP5K2_10255, partial [bacterium]
VHPQEGFIIILKFADGIRVVQTGNGSEFLGVFDKYLKERGNEIESVFRENLRKRFLKEKFQNILRRYQRYTLICLDIAYNLIKGFLKI